MSNKLQGKRAVVFGAGDSIGAAVAKEFAPEGAEVFFCGRCEKARATATPAATRSVASFLSCASGAPVTT
jgi:NAD(P)-dependent dehydrogenase (short-subunit alcohol dehydrogenase family)